jgi:GT2 family glycosyltransferase
MIPVIIPFYKNKGQLDRCLSNLERQRVSLEVFIRDNSRDNVYFTAAINEGILRYIDQPVKYLILLNQDMYLDGDAIEEMVNFMNRNPRCGIGAPLQLHVRDRNYVIWGGSCEAFPLGRHQHGPLHRFRDDEPVPWANGACMILRKEMVREIGLLDKNLVFIGSDSDYSFTARARGWEVWRIAAARGVHEHGASGVSHNSAIERLKVRDMIYFAHKWLTGDQYRQLAYEGWHLSPQRIVEIMDELTAAERHIVAGQADGHTGKRGAAPCALH